MKKLFLFLIFFISFYLMAEERQGQINLGVLSLRGPLLCLEQWQPTADYLSNELSHYQIRIIPISFDDVDFLVDNSQIDFLISNPYLSSYGYFKNQHYPIATMIKKQLDHNNTVFGGVIFHKKSLSFELKDINKFRISAVHKRSFGGWLASLRELNELGIHINKTDKVRFLNTHDAVVYSVASNEADIGFVRTGILESLNARGQIDINDYKVVHEHGGGLNHLPFLHSTRSYPEWSISALTHVDQELVKQVSLALLELPNDSEAGLAAGIQGWTPPLNYSSVFIEFGDLSLDFPNKPSPLSRVVLHGGILFFLLLFFFLGRFHVKRKTYFYMDFFNRMTSGIAIYMAINGGEDFKIVNMNESGLRISKKDTAIIGKQVLEVFPYYVTMGLFQCLKDCFKTGQEQYLPTKDYKEDEFVIWMDNRVFKLKSGYIAVIFDDRSAMHELQEKMKQVEKMDSMGKLAGGIAHDFNNILSGVLGYAELSLEIAGDNETLRDYLENILRAGDRASKLVQQILSFSRQKDSSISVTDVNELIVEINKLLRASFPPSISLSHDLAHDMNMVEIDSNRLHEAIINLCTNARDAMEGRGLLEIKTQNVHIHREMDGLIGPLMPGDYVKITVKDSGAGIRKAHMEQIFEPFFSTKPEGKGTGIGLSVVYSVMKEHYGNIIVNSLVGVGSEFCLYLPASFKKIETLKNGVSEIIDNQYHIMVIDDEPDILDIVKSFYESLNHRVEVYLNGEEALSAYKRNPFAYDLVICDYFLPSSTGKEVALEFQKIKPDTPFLICTGNPIDLENENYRACGIWQILKKPVSFKTLYEILWEIRPNVKG